jgi:hypothetical protein
MNIHRILLAATAVVAATTIAARADGPLRPIQGKSIDLGAVSGTVYYTVEQDGYRVVATFGERGEGATPVRLEALLAPGQSVTLSTPRGPGQPAEAVEITRQANALVVHKAGTPFTN